MDFFESPDGHNDILGSVNRFEKMVEDRDSYYFDCAEFQDIIEYYIGQGDFERAEIVVNYSRSQHPTNTDLKLLEATVLVGKLEYKNALELLSEIEVLEPNNPDVLLMKGAVYGKLKMTDKAIACFERCLKTTEFKDEVYYLMAVEYQHDMEYEKAIGYYKKSLEENPENEAALYEINMCFECVTDFKDAVQFYNRFLDSNPYSETGWFNLGGVYSKLEEWDKAVDAYDFAIAINPHFGSAYFNKANALASAEKYEEAIKAYKETYEYESPTFVTFCYIGECYERSKNYEKALKYYNRALNDNSDYGDAWLGKAICLDALGKGLDAFKSIQHAIELNREEPDYWYTASEIEEKLGYIEDSIASMKKALSIDSTDPSLHLDYLLLLERHLDNNTVKDNLDDAVSRFPNNAKILLFKCAFLLKTGVYQQAYQAFELALTIDFSSHEEVFKFYPGSKNNQNLLELIDLYRD